MLPLELQFPFLLREQLAAGLQARPPRFEFLETQDLGRKGSNYAIALAFRLPTSLPKLALPLGAIVRA